MSENVFGYMSDKNCIWPDLGEIYGSKIMRKWVVLCGDCLTIVSAQHFQLEDGVAVFYEDDTISSILSAFKKFDSITPIKEEE